MRALSLLLAVTLVGCSNGGAASEPATPPIPRPTTAMTSIDDCLVDGRSLEFDAEVRGWFRQLLAQERAQGSPVPNFNHRSGTFRIGPAEGSLYRYTTEFTFVRVPDGWEFIILAWGTVDATTCEAVLMSIDVLSDTTPTPTPPPRTLPEATPTASPRVTPTASPRTTPTPPTAVQCMNTLGEHRQFASLVRAEVDRIIERAGGGDIRHVGGIGGLLLAGGEWHPYEMDHHVVFTDSSREVQSRQFYARGAIHTETCEARLDSVE